ncbi:alpha-hydroxy-acid oxidizing protein [Dactylosporangium vinaceum]|uniref:Alpha-hydroxy acid oxidase n=1 Tax=Dactylosporangium vinaceum TaxID=53362 RepID=A0ABV5MS97_9ACTN|nr:alpha-hydroxy acid oxidase [Dactylosporangium vinaceum]UAC00212.1 alpha-hydroxy-acid oxidizing protein [Dactylosporangium vinaceum]
MSVAANPASVYDIARLARTMLPGHIWDYLNGGAGQERTLGANRAAFHRLSLVPAVLTDVSRRDLRTTLLGAEVAAPVAVAPMAYHRLAHVDAEPATVRAAGAEGLLCVVSTFASHTLEEIAAEATGPLWFQLYCLRDRGLTKDLVDRARAAGYRALVLTADAPMLGYRDRDIRTGFQLPAHVRPANLAGTTGSGATVAELNSVLVDPSVTWRDVAWLRGLSDLPVVVKGVLRAADAQRAVDHGADGVLVSNHGGRQVDGAIATMRALPAVLDAVGDRCEVYVDGGVRRGTDVLRALASGARAAFVGRPVLWGLAADGEAGVRAVLRVYSEELELTMAACGCPDVTSAGPELLAAGVDD